jgi:hypothetical protein
VAAYSNFTFEHFEEAFTSERWIVRIFARKKKGPREQVSMP